jgi:hypothetical protein
MESTLPKTEHAELLWKLAVVPSSGEKNEVSLKQMNSKLR